MPRRFGRAFGLGLGPFGPGGMLHGEFVTTKQGGGYQTVDVQIGKVTAVSSTSITLKSDDGFTNTYAVNSSTVVDANRDGIGSVKTGDNASVFATASGGTATAQQLTDQSNLKALGDRVGAPRWKFPPQFPAAPMPPK